jgi:hypothetical protein
MKRLVWLVALAAALLGSGTAWAQTLPTPVLRFLGTEAYTANGRNWVRYRFEVFNRDQYPDALFAAAPDLPPCGKNANAARSWVDFFAANGKRVYGFCALGTAANLGKIWFAVAEGEVPPSWVYIELWDRKTNIKLKSNLAETAG